MLRPFVNYEQDDWIDFLPSLEIAYNSSVNASTGFTPFELDCGWVPRSPHDLVIPPDEHADPSVDAFISRLRSDAETAHQMMQEAQERQRYYANMHRRDQRFSIGDLVLVSSAHIEQPWERFRPNESLSPTWLGPWKVLEIVNDNAYRLQIPADMKIWPVLNSEYLKPYVSSLPEFSAHNPERTAPEYVKGNVEFFKAEAILDVRPRGRGRQFLLKWKGRPRDESTWRPETEVRKHDPQLLDVFLIAKGSVGFKA